jgi:hypothetical protein
MLAVVYYANNTCTAETFKSLQLVEAGVQIMGK